MPVPNDYQKRPPHPADLGLPLFHRQLPFQTFQPTLAQFFHRTSTAFGIFGQADGRAEFHHGLVVPGGIFSIDKFLCRFLQPLFRFGTGDVAGIGGDAGEDPNDVAVENRFGLVEADARNRGGGVGADSGQFDNFVVGGGERSARDDLPGGFAQIAGARVVTQSGPGFEKLVVGRGREFVR